MLINDIENDIFTFSCLKRETNRKTIDREALFFNLGHQKVKKTFLLSVIEM